MILKCLGSSSAGNCYLLESETECLVIEAGIKFSEVKKALDFNIGQIVGVVASHSHKDHLGYAEEYLRAGFPVYASEETHGSLSKEYDNQVIVRPGYWYKAGDFTITPFSAEHDVECFGYIIEHEEMGKLLFATDTSFIKYNFKNQKLNHIMIECNYSIDIVNEYYAEDSIERARVDRLINTHMELQTTKEFIRANQTSNLDNVILLHLSSGNSNKNQFIDEVQEVVGGLLNVYVADNGLEVGMNLFPW